MYANSKYTVCMYVCMCVSAVVTSMEVQLRYIEPFDIGEWQRMYRPELLDYSGILQIHPAAERITSEWMVPVTATLALLGMFQSHLRYLTTVPFPLLKIMGKERIDDFIR